VLDFRRDTLTEMLVALDMVATEIRPPSIGAERLCRAGWHTDTSVSQTM
jgi:hypothetical protein